jgi:glycosyltransferase involved in cell wall biosynthesis
MSERKHLAHLIGDLPVGGAERVLYSLLQNADRDCLRFTVISLRPGGALIPEIESLGIPVVSMDLCGGRSAVPGFRRLVRWLRCNRPDGIATWLYHANLIGSLAAQLAGNIPVLWNIHHATLLPETIKWATRVAARIGGRFSRSAAWKIIHVAESGRRWHADFGYCDEKSVVIPNGFDLDRFRPDAGAKLWLRKLIGRSTSTPMIGLIGRFHPDKDHQSFIRAAALLRSRRSHVEFVLCGNGADQSNRQLCRWIEEAELQDAVHLLGPRSDVARIMAGLDLLVSSSVSEAFPNVIGEAMASGVPCVVTNVGDSALIVGDNGRIVEPSSPATTARACEELLSESAADRQCRSVQARKRIASAFDIKSTSRRHYDLWNGLVHLPRACSTSESYLAGAAA